MVTELFIINGRPIFLYFFTLHIEFKKEAKINPAAKEALHLNGSKKYRIAERLSITFLPTSKKVNLPSLILCHAIGDRRRWLLWVCLG